MIDLSTLCEQIESRLNANTAGKVFKIFSDTGDYFKAVRAGNTVTESINGLAQVVQSSITPTQGLVVATQQVRLEFAFPVEEYNIPLGEDGEVVVKTVEEITEEVRGIYEEAFQTAYTEILTDGDKRFAITVMTYPMTTGERNQRQIIGDSMTLVAYLDFSLVEGGLSSFNCPIMLDGETLPYTALAIDRTPAAEANAYSDSDGVAKTRILSTALSVRVLLPAVDDSTAWGSIKNYLLNLHDEGTESPSTTKHKLAICLGDFSGGEPVYTEFTVYITDTALSLNSGEYAGLTVNFVEAVDYGAV